MASRRVLQHLDGGAVSQLQRFLANVVAGDPSSPAAGEFWYDSVTGTFQFRNASASIDLGRLDQISAPTNPVALNSQRITGLADPTSAQDAATRAYILARTINDLTAPTADFSMNTHKITGVVDPTSAQDAATKAYVDAVITGLDLREAARVAAKTNITVASGIVNGAVIDGVTLATGDRVLLTAQTAPAENGVYITAASGAASRATDLDTAAEFDAGVLVPVQEGTANKGLYMHTTVGAITLGTTALVFTDLTPRSTGSVSKFTGTGPGSGAASWAIAHNLGTQFVTVQLYDASTLAQVEADIILTDANTATASFASSQTANSIRAVVTG